MFFPGAAVYMDKIAVGPRSADAIDIEAPPAENVRRVAKAKGDRADRGHASSSSSATGTGPDRGAARGRAPRCTLITDGDVAPAIAAAQPNTGVDLLMGWAARPRASSRPRR